MPEIQFFGQSSEAGDNRWSSTSRLINLYTQRVGARRILKTVLGTATFSEPAGTYCRAMATVDGTLYVIQQSTLYRIESDGDATSMGSVSGDPDATMAGNNGRVCIASAGKYYVLSGESLTEIPVGGFDDIGSVTFFRQFTILTEEGGRRVQWSRAADPNSFDAIDVATAEVRDGDIIRGMAVGPELWIFKGNSIERWAYLGTAFGSIDGTAIDIGLKALKLATEIPNGAFFIGADNKVYLAGGGQVQPIGSAGVNYSIAYENPLRVIHYQDEGQDFCAIIFDNRPAWVFDMAMGEWHERASGNDLGPWNVRAAVKAYGRFMVGTDTAGILELVRTNKDGDDPIVRRAVSDTLSMGGERFRVSILHLTGRVGWAGADPGEATVPIVDDGTGEGIDDGTGAAISLLPDSVAPDDEIIELRVSRDSGHTWTEPKPKSIGFNGEYDRRVAYRALGFGRQFTAEITMSRLVEFGMDSVARVEVA